MTENKNMLNIKMDNKEMIRIGAIAVLILDVILMLSAYINIDAINQLANLVSGFSETNIDSGSGKYTLFGVISLVRKFIVLYNGGDYIFGSYIFAIFFWILHIFAVLATLEGAVNLIRKKGSLYSRGKGGMILGAALAALTIAVSIVVNGNAERQTSGLISEVISFCPAPFIVCIICVVYQLWLEPKIELNLDRDTQGSSYELKEDLGGWTCRKCGARNNDNAKYCVACSEPKEEKQADDWVCTRCNNKNLGSSKFCTTCGAQKEQVQVSKSNSWICKKCDARNDESAKFCINCGAPKAEPQVETKEISFMHTCSQCGKNFKVTFNINKGQNTIPKLSAICPQCGAKENITF